MSRTQPNTVIPSPVEQFIFFNGNTGRFGRPVEENTQMEDLPLPLAFIVLDDGAFRIGGENRALGKRKIKSGLAHRNYNKSLTVTYSDNGSLIAQGDWQQIRESVAAIGGKYTAVLYALVKLDGQSKIAAIHLRGRALSEWYKFTKGKNPTGPVYFTVTKTAKTEGTDVDSYVPVFEMHDLKASSQEEADAADAILQNWLSGYFKSPENIPAAINSRASNAVPIEGDAFAFAGLEEPPAQSGTGSDFDDDLPF